MRKRRKLWVLVALTLLISFDVIIANRLKTTGTLKVDAVTLATPVTHSTVGVIRSDNSLLRDPVSPTEPLDYERIKGMVWTAIELAPTKTGPLPSIIPENSWVVVKPNMVFLKPQGGYCLGDITDPRVTRAVLEYLAEHTQARRITLAMGGSWQAIDSNITEGLNFTGIVSQNGGRVDGWTATWGDDYPGFAGSFQDLLDALSAAHPEKIFDKGDFNYDVYPNAENPQKVPVPVVDGIGGWSVDSYYVSNMILDCDVLISVPTMKPHDEAGVTLAHKNYVGTASRLMYNRGNWWNAGIHTGTRGVDGAIVDLFSYHPADFTIIGGAWGVEGQGPHKNSRSWPIRTNIIIAGPDPVASDAVAATIMGFNPWDIEHLRLSAAKGYGTLDMNYITVRGDAIDKVAMKFEKPKDSSLGTYYGRGNRAWLIHGVHEGADLDQDFLGGEADMSPFEGETVSGQVWTKIISAQDEIDLKNFFYDRYGSYQKDVVAYAFTYIYSEVDQPGFLWIGSDDGIKVWLNGELVWTNPNSGSHWRAEDRVPVVLKSGENRLLLKVKNDLGSYAFSLAVTDGSGSTLPKIYYHTDVPVASVVESSDAVPGHFALGQNYPNPFNTTTVIRFALPASEKVELAVHNLIGQKVATLVEGVWEAGTYTVHWDGRDDSGRPLGSGVYLYRLQTGQQQVEMRKLLLLR